MRPPKVLHFLSWFPHPAQAELGNFVVAQLELIGQISQSVGLHCYPAKEDSLRWLQYGEVRVLQMAYRRRWPWLSRWRAERKGYRLVQQQYGPFELYHLHVCYPAGIFTWLSAKKPLIISEHASKFLAEAAYPWPRLEKWLSAAILKRAAVIVPVSQALAQRLQSWAPETKIQVIPNLVLPLFKPPTKDEKRERFHFLHLSSLEEKSKNISGLLKGMAPVLTKHPQAVLRIGGDGDLAALKAKIKAAGLPEAQVEVLPKLSRQAVAQAMQAADCFVLFSHYESQSVVLLEALASGLPVIAPKVGGVPEFVGPEEGFLVDPERPESLSAAAESMLLAPPRDRKAIAQKIQAGFGEKRLAQEFSALYASVRPAGS